MSYIDEGAFFYGPIFEIPARTEGDFTMGDSGDQVLDRLYGSPGVTPGPTSPLVLLDYLAGTGFMIRKPSNYDDKLSLRQVIVYRSLPDTDTTTGYLSVMKPFKAAVQRRMTAWIGGVHGSADEGDFWGWIFASALEAKAEINADIGRLESVKTCLTGDYATSYWRTYIAEVTSVARKSSTDSLVEVLYESTFNRIADYRDSYFVADTAGIRPWTPTNPITAEMLHAKRLPEKYTQPADHSTGGAGYEVVYSTNTSYDWAMIYRYGYAGIETADHISEGWVSSPSRRDTFVDQIMTNLHSLVSSATGIPKEYRVRMQQSPSFDPRKLTAMPTATTGTSTASTPSSPLTSPSDGSY